MRIFASWSGAESRQIAELLRWWIPSVIQDAEVYVSSQDIGKGERWQASVGANLAENDFGIIVVTKATLTAPWILFEAGALSKSVKGIVVPLLCGIENIETANSPLAQFQYVRPVEAEMYDLLVQINKQSSKPLRQDQLVRAFEKWWPDFESAYSKIDLSDHMPAEKETDSARLETIENALNGIMSEMRRLRSNVDAQPRPRWADHFETVLGGPVAGKLLNDFSDDTDVNRLTAIVEALEKKPVKK